MLEIISTIAIISLIVSIVAFTLYFIWEIISPYLDSEVVKKLKSGELQEGDLIIVDYTETLDNGSRFDHVIIENNPEEGFIRYSLIREISPPSEHGGRRFVIDTGAIHMADKEKYSRMNRRSELYKYKKMSNLSIKFHIDEPERRVETGRLQAEVMNDDDGFYP